MSFAFRFINDGIKFHLEETGESLYIRDFEVLRVSRDGSASINNAEMDVALQFPFDVDVSSSADCLVTISLETARYFINGKKILRYHTKNAKLSAPLQIVQPEEKWIFYVQLQCVTLEFGVASDDEKVEYEKALDRVMGAKK